MNEMNQSTLPSIGTTSTTSTTSTINWDITLPYVSRLPSVTTIYFPEDFYGKIRMTLTGEVEVFNGSEYIKVPRKQKSYISTEEELLEQEILKMKGEIS